MGVAGEPNAAAQVPVAGMNQERVAKQDISG
jgi:hypothetical protein